MKIAIISILILLSIFNGYSELNAEQILAQGNLSFLSCQKIYAAIFLLYSKNENSFGEIFVKEFNLNWKEVRERKLGINGASAYLAYFNDRFYLSYTSFEKDGKVHIAEFDANFNFQRDIPIHLSAYVGEWAYQLINIDDGSLYLLYARNWGYDCGLKMAKFNRDLEMIQEVSLIKGALDFHLYASEFTGVIVNDRLYVACKSSRPPESKTIFSDTHPPENMNIFVDEYTLEGKGITRKCIDREEKLSPALFFEKGIFYLAYEGYDYNLSKNLVYVKQYDSHWNLLKAIRIATQETGAPRNKFIFISQDNCFLVSVSMDKSGAHKIFMKKVNFDLKEDKIDLTKAEKDSSIQSKDGY